MKLFVLAAAVVSVKATPDACTATILGNRATLDGSTVVTQTADCFNCDFRLAKITQHENPHLVRKYKATYPAEVSNRSLTWSQTVSSRLDVDAAYAPFENEVISRIQEAAWRSDAWQVKWLAGEVSVAEVQGLSMNTEDYESFESLFGIMNSEGLAFGESTCEATLIGKAVRECISCQGPLVDIGALSKIAMRFCATARCAIRVMGELAEKYGYYGAEMRTVEAGEALTIADGTESWMFHIMPDYSGLSALWVAQRVPNDSVSICANAFVIRGVPERDETMVQCLWEEHDDCDFLVSPGLFDSAESQRAAYGHEIYFDETTGFLDFAKTFGPRPDNTGFPYSVHRVWRVMSLLAPNATREYVKTHNYDYLGSELPFAIKVERHISIHEVLNYQRDYYQGTNFDLTKGLAAGPWGDPTRYDGAAQGLASAAPDIESLLPPSVPRLLSGRFERAISMFRTSYSIAVQSFSSEKHRTPVTWFAQSAPHAGIYVPLTLDGGEVPKPHSSGSLFEFTQESLFWQTLLIANWMRANIFKLARIDVDQAQRQLEHIFHKAILEDSPSGRNARLANTALLAWKQLFTKLVTKFHDGFRLFIGNDPTKMTEPDVRRHFYPDAWLKRVGFYTPDRPDHYYDDDDDTSIIPEVPQPLPSYPFGTQENFLSRRLPHDYTLPLRFAHFMPALINALFTIGILAIGFISGRAIERRRHRGVP